MKKRKGAIVMSTRQPFAPVSVEELLEAIERLSPIELSEFSRQFTVRQHRNGRRGEGEAALVKAAKARLPSPEQRRLKRLTAKSEQGTLTPKELADYRVLAKRAERLNVKRVEALARPTPPTRRRGASSRSSTRAGSAGRGTLRGVRSP
jgi:hypothetical protein